MDIENAKGTPINVALIVAGSVGFLVVLSILFKGKVHF